MIRHPLGLRLNPDGPLREQIQEAARLGARGVVLDAVGDLAPQRLSATGRRELRHILRTVELALVALSLPTRRPFDTTDQLEDRIRRADSAFAMAFELGTRLVVTRAGQVPDVEDKDRREIYATAISSLGERADHRGVRLALETGTEPGSRLREFLESQNQAGLAASIDPPALLHAGIDPVLALRELNTWVAHAYASETVGSPGSLFHSRTTGSLIAALDWPAFLGALEEIGYAGFLTVWPDATRDTTSQWNAIVSRLRPVL
jgi:sugar phosphate isomerase/epimerase